MGQVGRGGRRRLGGIGRSGRLLASRLAAPCRPPASKPRSPQNWPARYDVPPPEVNCPLSVPARVGTHFTCTATLDGQPWRVVGTVTDAHGAMSRCGPTSAVVVVATAEAEIGKSLSRTFRRPVHVSCAVPSLWWPTRGLAFGCTADVAGVERTGGRNGDQPGWRPALPGAAVQPRGRLVARSAPACRPSLTARSAQRGRSPPGGRALPPVAAFILPMKKPASLSSPPA